MKLKRNLQILFAAVFGIIFLTAIIVIAIMIPNPTEFQYLVFRITLALAAGGIAAMIPGILNVSIPNFITAGGALAVFVIVYFYSPAKLAIQHSPVEKRYIPPESVLLKQRQDAKRLFEESFLYYQIGRTEVSAVISANNKLLEAELALSSGPGARVSAYEAALKRAKELASMADQMAKMGMTRKTDISETSLHRTQIEVGLAREQSRPDK